MKSFPSRPSFVVAVPFRSVCDQHARYLEEQGMLRIYATWNRRGTAGIPAEKTKLLPLLGLLSYVASKTLSPFHGESFRFALHTFYDRWVQTLLKPGDHILSSYGHTNHCFQWVRSHGGQTFLDAGNSHPQNFWQIISQEHKRWGCTLPPVSSGHYQRSLDMMKNVDHVLAPSRFVEDSFLKYGFTKRQIARIPYATDLSIFKSAERRPAERPFTVINTGGLSLRKGTPYLLEALRILKNKIPDMRILLTKHISDSIRPILGRYNDLPIEWSKTLPPNLLAERLRSADLFILPSLEEGMARTALEAMACGLPVILTPNTGSSDLVDEGINGSIVPIRSPEVIVEKALFWQKQILGRGAQGSPIHTDLSKLAYPHFSQRFGTFLKKIF